MTKLLDDIGHFGIGLGVGLPCGMAFNLGWALSGQDPVTPVALAATVVGAVAGAEFVLWLREEHQMIKAGDTTFGWNRWRDVLGGLPGAALGGLLAPLVNTAIVYLLLVR